MIICRFIAILLIAFYLAGCSASTGAVAPQPTASFADFLSKVQALTLADVKAAQAVASPNDFAAQVCYPGIIDFLTMLPTVLPKLPSDQNAGLFWANQLKRNVIIDGTDKNSPLQLAVRALHVQCAGYVMDEVRWQAEFAAMIGAASKGVQIPGGLK